MSLIFTLLLTVSAILLNIWLIPLYGMNGSAFANFGSYLIYFICLLILVKWKLNISVFSWGQLKALVVVGILFGLNFLWTKTLTPLFAMLPIKEIISALIEGALRTGVLLLIGVASVYYWRISPEINNLIDKVLKRA